MTSLFGNNAATGSSSLFGGNAQNQGSSLFGGSTNTQTQQQAAAAAGPGTGAGLFGGSTGTQQQQNTGGSLFGATNANPQQGTSLFGGGNAATQNQAPGGSLFGGGSNTANSNQGTTTNTGGSLFGGSTLFSNSNAATTTNTQASTLFSTNTQQQQQQPPPQHPTATKIPPGLFQTLNTAPTPTPPTQPPQTHLSTLLQSGLGGGSQISGLSLTSQQDLARSRLTEANIISRPSNEKPIIAQIQTLIRKWDPQSQDTLLQKYLYNAVNSAYAPFYYRNADEDENSWEEALAQKPEPLHVTSAEGGGGGENISFVPVLVRGFHALGQRIEYQARTVNEMRARLHEMNNSLNAILARHQQHLSVRIDNARRQHEVLRQRCLRLAVKAQVLRHRNYPLDAAEEGLRRTLLELEKQVFDPQFRAREEEIWARMVALRERARWLEEEGKRVEAHVEQSGAAADGGGSGRRSGVSEEVLQKTRRILRDYDGQLAVLARELEEVKMEFEGWERGGRHTGGR